MSHNQPPAETGQQENCSSLSLWDTHCGQRTKAVDTSLPCSTPTHRISIEASGSEAAWNTKVDAPYRAGNKPVLASHCVRYLNLRIKVSPDKLICPEISSILWELTPSSKRPPLGPILRNINSNARSPCFRFHDSRIKKEVKQTATDILCIWRWLPSCYVARWLWAGELREILQASW